MPRVTKMRASLEETSPVPEAEPIRKSRHVSPAVMVLGVLLAITVSVAGYFYYEYRQGLKPADAEEIKNLTAELGKIMELPDGEVPTLATVTDKGKLADQPFFRKAENGDKVLIYTNNGRAIIYRPSTKKIIDVTAVNVNADQSGTNKPSTPEVQAPAAPPAEAAPATPAVSDAKPTPATVALYNGTKIVGMTNIFETRIKMAFPNISVVKKDKAVKNDYTKSVVVDVSGIQSSLAADIATKFGATVANLPDGEAKPDADVLVIVGGK